MYYNGNNFLVVEAANLLAVSIITFIVVDIGKKRVRPHV